MFGRRTLQPFRLFASGRRRAAALYAYADVDAEMLCETAEAVAPPDCITVIDTRRLRSKRMPEGFKSGRHLGFDVRLRPVRRLARDLRDPQSGRVMRKGQEVDAFRLAVIRRFPEGWADPNTAASRHGVTRESVYAEWLTERLGDAASLEEHNLAAFRRSRAVRGPGRMPEGPDATVHGTLSVTEPDRFADILRHGLGRHRAYGYGMLLLRPPARS